MSINKHKYFGTTTHRLRMLNRAELPVTGNYKILKTVKSMRFGGMDDCAIIHSMVENSIKKIFNTTAMCEYNVTDEYIGDALSRVENSYDIYHFHHPFVIQKFE